MALDSDLSSLTSAVAQSRFDLDTANFDDIENLANDVCFFSPETLLPSDTDAQQENASNGKIFSDPAPEHADVSVCVFCRSCSNLDPSLSAIQHYVCRGCLAERRDTHHYRCISQGRALKKFGLSLQELRTGVVCFENNYVTPLTGPIVVKEIPNPRGYGAPMKLYYEFQLMELCKAKYGSLEAAAIEIDLKEEQRFSRLLGKNMHNAAASTQAKASNAVSRGCQKRKNKADRKNTPANDGCWYESDRNFFSSVDATGTAAPPEAHSLSSRTDSSLTSIDSLPLTYWTDLAAAAQRASKTHSESKPARQRETLPRKKKTAKRRKKSGKYKMYLLL